MNKLIICISLLFLSSYSIAQNKQDWEKYYDQLSDIDDTESPSWESTYDILSELAANPIDINTATREDLEQLPFLNDQQIEQIQEYIYRYGGIKSWGELAMIESLDQPRQKLIAIFTTLENIQKTPIPSIKNILKYGKNDLIATATIPFNNRAGYDNGYLGYNIKHWLRYSYNYSRYLKIGFVASQDAGEPFFSGRNSAGYDYYSFYLIMRKMGRLKALAAGRYRLRFGMGLVLNNDFGFGKIATLATLGRQGNSINAHSSRMQANYLQGAAATVTIAKGLDLTGFVSYRKIDATLSVDSTITTILQTGYHRTPSEMNRKNNASQLLTGGNANYFNSGFHIGTTAIYTSFNRELMPDISQIYRYNNPAGKAFWNASMDYGYLSRKLSINGETATGSAGGLATLNSISYQLADNLSLMALQRFYSYRYYSLFSSSFSDGGYIQNESGVYLGGNWQPATNLSLMFYTDYAYFPWAKYQISRTSHSWDNFVSATYQRHNWQFLARYRIRFRQKDNADKSSLINTTLHRTRLSAAYTSARWSLKTQADMVYSKEETHSFGWMLLQNASYTAKKVRIDASVSYFDTDDYASRIYVYERGALYTYAFPSFYGNGMRYAANVRVDVNKNLMLLAKLGVTHYFDRSQISTGLQMIDGNTQSDLDLQLRWRF